MKVVRGGRSSLGKGPLYTVAGTGRHPRGRRGIAWPVAPGRSAMTARTLTVFAGLVALACPTVPYTPDTQCINVSPALLSIDPSGVLYTVPPRGTWPTGISRVRTWVPSCALCWTVEGSTPSRWPRRLALRGGSSAWSDALLQASVNGARNDLSMEDTCAALKTHGLVVSVEQVKELLGFGGATDVERVNEAQFSTAFAKHPPSSAVGRWQQVCLLACTRR